MVNRLPGVIPERISESSRPRSDPTPEMLAAGYEAMTSDYSASWVNGGFIQWIEDTTSGCDDRREAIYEMLSTVFASMIDAKGEKPSAQESVQPTPEMIKEGVSVLEAYRGAAYDELLVQLIYSAMASATQRECP